MFRGERQRQPLFTAPRPCVLDASTLQVSRRRTTSRCCGPPTPWRSSTSKFTTRHPCRGLLNPMKSLCASAQLAACVRLLYLTRWLQLHRRRLCHHRHLPRQNQSGLPEDGQGGHQGGAGGEHPRINGRQHRALHPQPHARQESGPNVGGAPPRARSCAGACRMPYARVCSCRCRCRNTRSFTTSSRMWRGAGLRRATSPSSACDGQRPQRPHWHSHACCSRTRSFTYKTQRALPGALLRSAIVTHATVMLELSPASKQAQV